MNEFELLNPEKRWSRSKLSLQIRKVAAAKWKRKPVVCMQGARREKVGSDVRKPLSSSVERGGLDSPRLL